jgi:hypothetical protein
MDIINQLENGDFIASIYASDIPIYMAAHEMLDALIEVQQLIRSGDDILEGTIDIIESAIASALKDRPQ